ncbi:hypothetical protein LMG26411_08143 [Cupriavidus numazuensis]|uniref:Uncharacterized protein n=1 Tax=Cupriavidus numazuensis TaxID=221992 RepID=A0ABM8TWZ5_9BURK|nr:hypothetical protein LMG26411_08143 [Cupriavidus numazuensis]
MEPEPDALCEPGAGAPAGRAPGPRGAGADLRRADVDLWRTERMRQPPCAPADRRGRGPGGACRHRAAALGGDGGGPAGDPEGGRCLCAARPRVSGGSAGVHGGRQRHCAAADAQHGHQPAGHARAAPRHSRPQCRIRPAPAGAGPRREPRLRDLHVRLHRQAQGRCRGPRPAVDACAVHRRGIRHDAAGPRAAVRVDRLRRRTRAHLGAAGIWRRADAAGQRSLVGRAHLRRDRAPRHHHRLLHAELPPPDGRAGRRSGPRPAHPLLHGRRRGNVACQLRPGPVGAAPAAHHQRLWPDRDGDHADDRQGHAADALRRCLHADRQAGRRPQRLCAGRQPAAGAAGCGRRTVPGASRTGPRLSESRGPVGGALRGRPVRQRGRPPVPHRRPGALGRRWAAGIPRAHRPSGQGPRLPHRAGRDRGAIAGAAGSARGRGGSQGRPPGGLRRRRHRRGGAARSAGPGAARLHGAGRDRRAQRAAAEP